MRYCLEEPRTSENELLKILRLVKFEDTEAICLMIYQELWTTENLWNILKYHEKSRESEIESEKEFFQAFAK